MITEYKLEPDISSYEYIIKNFCQHLNTEKAEEYISIMKSKSLNCFYMYIF